LSIWLVAAIVFLFNIPFGYWRANVRKFSLQWALSIHIPVPFVVAIRILSNIGFKFFTFPVIIAAFFGGQFVGGRIFLYLKKRPCFVISSCMVYDLSRYIISVWSNAN